MNRVLAGRAGTPGVRSTELVRLSKWVNEPYPPWTEILTAHDLARLTRRRRSALAVPSVRADRYFSANWHCHQGATHVPLHLRIWHTSKSDRLRRGAICSVELPNSDPSSPLRDYCQSQNSPSCESGILGTTPRRKIAPVFGRSICLSVPNT